MMLITSLFILTRFRDTAVMCESRINICNKFSFLVKPDYRVGRKKHNLLQKKEPNTNKNYGSKHFFCSCQSRPLSRLGTLETEIIPVARNRLSLIRRH